MTRTRRSVLQAASAAMLTPMSGAATSVSNAAPIRIGQIGTAHGHATKLSVYRESPDYEVVGLVEPDERRRRQLGSAAAFRDVALMTEEQLLNSPGLQMVLIETEVSDLLATGQRCLDAGKHIHLDKPAGESPGSFQRLLETAKAKHLIVQMGYMYRYNPGVLMLKEFLRQGWLGDIFEIHAVMSKVVPDQSRRELAKYSGGMMFELGCHLIDLVVGLVGEPESVHPFAAPVHPAKDGLADNMLAVLNYPRCLASVKSSAAEVDGFARRHLSICGTKGTFHMQPLDRPSVRVTFDEPHGEYRRGYQDVTVPAYRRYVADAADMVAVIRGEKTNEFSYEHDLAVQRTVLQASGLNGVDA